MNKYPGRKDNEGELVSVLTAISQVSMRLAMRLEVLKTAKAKKEEREKGGCRNEVLRSGPGDGGTAYRPR